MERILRAHPQWAERIADALRTVPRPIPPDERLLPRLADGRTTRERWDRRGFPPARPAATLLAIYPDAEGQLVIPLTIRRTELRAHAGEVSLPGGAVDETDASPEAAALREAWEEVGLDAAAVRIVGTLDDVWIPVSNYELRPFVGTLPARPTLVPHDAEVAAIVELPLDVLADPAALVVADFDGRGGTVRAGAYRHGDILVWGATAITLGMLARALDGTDLAPG